MISFENSYVIFSFVYILQNFIFVNIYDLASLSKEMPGRGEGGKGGILRIFVADKK